MKKGVIVVIALILCMPSVLATLELSGPTQTKYNIGDQIDVAGFIQQDEAFSGSLQLSLSCSDLTYTLQKTPVTLVAEEKVLLSELPLPRVTASSAMEGLCTLTANLLANGAQVETATSSIFEVSSDLDGSFSVDKSQVQLGETLTITGNVARLDGDLVTGSAELYFSSGNDDFLIGFMNVDKGTVEYEYMVDSGDAGKYSIDLIVRDSFGNEQKFTNADSFTVLDQLYVFVETNEETYFPGDVINVFGQVKTILQDYVDSAVVEITINGATESTSLQDSQFTHDFYLPTDIKSGQHAVKVAVRDTSGNAGSGTEYIEVDPLAQSAETQLSNGSLDPGDKLIIISYLYDQAGDQMDDDLVLEVYDAKGRLISEKAVFSGEQVTYQVPEFATPGDWKVLSYYVGNAEINDEDTVSVSSVYSLDYYVEGDILYITNTGNERYTEDFEITVDGEDAEYIIKKSKNLDVNETIVIDLAQELPSGSYSVAVPTGRGISEFADIFVEDGKPRSSLSWLYTILAVFFLGGLSFMIYKRVKPGMKKVKHEEAKHYVDLSARGETKALKGKKTRRFVDVKNQGKKKSSLTFDDKNKGLEDFKQRTLAEIKRTEEKINKDKARKQPQGEGKLGYVTGKHDAAWKPVKPVSPPPPQEKKPPGPSFFSLFD